MKKYHLTGSIKYFKDARTYYNVKEAKVEAGCLYMCNQFGLEHVFIYEASLKIGKNQYICAYSKKYNNFRYPNGTYSKSFNS